MTTRVIMLMMVTCLSMTAEAADETLPLACQGTVTETMMEEEKKPEPISIGIIVNFTNSTVQGFGNPDPNEDFPIKITGMNEATISFQGKRPDNSKAATDRRIEGTIDRVTGDVNATDTLTNLKTSKIAYSTRYALKCRPKRRTF
jgi:hypothetical protein